MGGGVHEVDVQFGAVHEDVHARPFFGPPKDARGRVIDLPLFLADLLAERIEAVGGRTLLFANRSGEPIRRTDFLRLWRHACDGVPAGYARYESEREAATAPVHRGLRHHGLRHTQDDADRTRPRAARKPPGMRSIYAHTTNAMREAMVEGLQGQWEHEQSRHSADS